jgi:exosome complex component RRP4
MPRQCSPESSREAIVRCVDGRHDANRLAIVTGFIQPSVQIQQLHKKDQSISLSMRGSKFRKLRKGRLVVVPASCIRRKSSHFVDVAEAGIQLITGCNGWLWIGVTDPAAAAPVAATGRARPFGGVTGLREEDEHDFEASAEQWAAVARYAAAAQALAQLRLPVFAGVLQEVVEHSVRRGVRCPDMLGMDFLSEVVTLEEQRRGATAAMDIG